MLKELINKNLKYKPTYGKRKLANHLPMALFALHKMGANSEQLSKFYDNYSVKLDFVSESNDKEISLDFHNWENYLGQSEAYSSFFKFFKETIQATGMDKTIKQFLPILIKGIASQAFHCLIRLAYSVEIKDPYEVAAALAYFASEYVILMEMKRNSSNPSSPEEILLMIQSNQALCGMKYTDPTITDRLLRVVALPEFVIINQACSFSEFSLRECAAVVIRIYAATNDFTALHMVTAAHALRILSPHISNIGEALRYYWQAVAAAYISIGSPNFSYLEWAENFEKTWMRIFAEVTGSCDDHLIKLIYSCHEEGLVYQSDIYKRVAEKLGH